MTTRKKSTATITLRTVLEHVQALHGEMLSRFADVDRRFAAVDRRFVNIDQRFDTLERRLSQRIDRVERNLTLQIDNIDKRLDDIEVVQIPLLKKAVGAR